MLETLGVEKGDRLLAVNGLNVEGMRPRDLRDLLKVQDFPLKLYFRPHDNQARSIPGPPGSKGEHEERLAWLTSWRWSARETISLIRTRKSGRASIYPDHDPELKPHLSFWTPSQPYNRRNE